MSRKKLLIAAALAVGLLGGGAAGALLGVPSIAQAQTDQSTTTTTTEGTSDGPLWWRGRGHCVGASLESAAESLGMSTDELEDALAAASSIAEVAAGEGVAAQAVIDAMVADATARLDEAVAEGDLSADRAEEKKAELPEWITAIVNGEAPLGWSWHGGAGWD